MKKIEFKLINPVRLIPIKGDSYVKVETNGTVTIQDPAASEDRGYRRLFIGWLERPLAFGVAGGRASIIQA